MVLAAAIAALTFAFQPPHLRFVLYGDCRDGHEVHRKLIKLIQSEGPALVLQTGDLVHRDQPDLWKTYDAIVAPLKAQAIIYPARGNHDLGSDAFDKRVPDSVGKNKLYYSFSKANCHFVCLAVDEQIDYKPGSPQYNWLVKDLKADKAQHTFVYFHVPPYSIGAHGSDPDVRAALCPVFEKYHVEAVLNGHDHNYYRTVRNGIAYIVSGGGGAPLYPTFPQRGAIEGDKWESVNHYVVFDVDGATVKGKAVRSDGTTLDTFTLRARTVSRK